MNATCTVRLPADAGELVQRPRDAVRPDVFARQVKLRSLRPQRRGRRAAPTRLPRHLDARINEICRRAARVLRERLP